MASGSVFNKKSLCSDVNVTRADRYPSSIRLQIHGLRHGKLFFCSVHMMRGFENVCEIISD